MKLMRWTLLIVSLVIACPVRAAGDAKPAALTPKEVEEGWIQLFDGETLFGWKQVGEGKWTIAEGMLAPQKDNKASLVTTTPFADYVFEMEFRARGDSTAKVLVGCDANGAGKPNSMPVELGRRFGGEWTTLKVTVKDGSVSSVETRSERSASKSGTPSSSGEPPPARSGYLAITGEHFVIRKCKLLPKTTKPIFDGKDLSGWKEIPGKKTKFSVSKDGLLELKDGPGDLQSEGQWANFVLQIDCRCNGDSLNSGVFFRCRPDEFWQGYESQIYNKSELNKTWEYKLEDYDPETHKLKGTRMEKYPVADYGTGGIYNRQPARLPVAKDREWFTMSVAAHGRHIGVWVNGIMVTDWTDNRPETDNARKGCRLEKGAISLQGHDATTDLSFRNIRIVELPPVGAK